MKKAIIIGVRAAIVTERLNVVCKPLSSVSDGHYHRCQSRHEHRKLTHTVSICLYSQAIISGVEAAVGTASDEQ